ncbi:MAG: hypothetical protein V3V08_06240 [Nannocystaceae bacterium]
MTPSREGAHDTGVISRFAGVDVVVEKIQGVDVLFRARPTFGGPEEGFDLVPRIEGGCLFVGEYLPIWPSHAAQKVENAVTAALDGDDVRFPFAGNGLGKHEIKGSENPTNCTFDRVLLVTE